MLFRGFDEQFKYIQEFRKASPLSCKSRPRVGLVRLRTSLPRVSITLICSVYLLPISINLALCSTPSAFGLPNTISERPITPPTSTWNRPSHQAVVDSEEVDCARTPLAPPARKHTRQTPRRIRIFIHTPVFHCIRGFREEWRSVLS